MTARRALSCASSLGRFLSLTLSLISTYFFHASLRFSLVRSRAIAAQFCAVGVLVCSSSGFGSTSPHEVESGTQRVCDGWKIPTTKPGDSPSGLVALGLVDLAEETSVCARSPCLVPMHVHHPFFSPRVDGLGFGGGGGLHALRCSVAHLPSLMPCITAARCSGLSEDKMDRNWGRAQVRARFKASVRVVSRFLMRIRDHWCSS